MIKSLISMGTIALAFSIPMVNAEQYTIFAKDLNRYIQTEFPITRIYDGVEAEFTHPELIILHLDNEIKIKVKIQVTYQEQTLMADGLIVDQVSLESVSNTLRFQHPKLEEFFVSQDNMSDSAEAIKVIKQTIAITLPPITLLHLEKLNFRLVTSTIPQFSLSPQGLLLEYD